MRFSLLLTAALSAAIAAPALAQDLHAGGKFDFDFSQVDLNGDGLLSADEFAAILPSGVNKSLAAQMIRQLDGDGDGSVTAAELTELAISGAQKAPVMPDLAILAPFGQVDLDGDGKITPAELDARGDEPIQGFHAMYLAKADKDRDGRLSKSEWDAERPTVTVSASAN